ncbi:MAG: MFS transporter [Candidatus Adiutrix sp.]|jgi:MFS family permease|nr:MFS transporter [Candidatus Adiutrix sp.]
MNNEAVSLLPHQAVEPRDRRLVLAMAVLANLLGNMGLVGINLALPDLERSLGLSAVLLGWVPLSQFMAMAAVAAPGAKLADIWGRRRTTIISLLLAIAGLVLSALAREPVSLFVGRVLTGLGLAVVFTNLTAMATSVHPPEMRGRVLGYTVSSVYVGLSLGPLTCGYLVGWFGWRAVFWLSVAGFLPPLIICLMVRVEQRPARGEKLDRLGSLWWLLAIAALFFGLTNITQFWTAGGLRLPLGALMMLLGLIFSVAYVVHSLKSPNPVLDMRLFLESRRFAFSSLAAFISYSASTGAGLLLSLYLQYTRAYPAATAGLILMIQPAFQALITPFTGRLSDRLDAGLMASAGMGVLCLALLVLALALTPETPLSVFAAILMLLGLGFATFAAPNSNAIIGAAPPSRVGQAAGTITATRLCGQVSSIALTTLVFSQVIGPGRITPDKYPDFMAAATVCFSIFAPICLVGVLASLARGRNKVEKAVSR